MPTLTDIRTAGEADLQDILKGLDERHKRKVRQAVKRYGRVQDVPQAFWDELRDETENETVTALYLLMLASDDWTADAIKGQKQGLRAGQPDIAAYSLKAGRRAMTLADRTTDTLRNRLATRIEDAKLSRGAGSELGEMTPEELDAAIDDVFTQARRDAIAANETTGSMSAGQLGGRDRFAPGSLRDTAIDLVWVTERDDRVCPRCSPLDGTTEDVWGLVFPDGPGEEAHVNCRCELKPVVRALNDSERVSESFRESEEDGEGKWITLDNGVHVKIVDGESVDDAIARLSTGAKSTDDDADHAEKTIRARLGAVMKGPNTSTKTRQHIGQVKDFWKSGELPPRVADAHVFFDPNFKGAAAQTNGTVIVLGPGAIKGHGSSQSLGDTFVHEVEHLHDEHSGIKRNEFTPRLRQVVRQARREPLAAFQGRHGMDNAEHFARVSLRSMGYDASDLEVTHAARAIAASRAKSESFREEDDSEGRWVTLDNGAHVKIKAGETLDAAIDRTFGKANEKEPAKPRKQTETPEFKKWFGDSKVVDEKGEPLAVHHGTRNPGFTQFEVSDSETGRGVFFTDNIFVAEDYAKGSLDFDEDATGKPHDSAGIYSTYLRIQNPKVFDVQGEQWFRLPMKKMLADAAAAGHDGVVMKNIRDAKFNKDMSGTGYVVFSPSQIKSATGNRGTFNPDSDDIRESQDA